MSPTVTVLYFGVLRERRGVGEEAWPWRSGCTLEQLYAEIFPPGPEGAVPVAYACNQIYVPGSTCPAPGDEVVFVPPVGGG